ncbi:MAG: 50S ribosomal protein L4 [Candidatus Magasanikbacteria bacterium RIFOXYD2_FULL_36_9]|uniref:Large ribosomal subunit protein uL4 n=1 Tax=Candidatus Magasanikbacteria bacterium RIFOXYD2_FULL_36_9 TaxID=1798707 RepID=A0A1F6P1H4_9BACT|nr:MAG: 50S ribosomal protein L4 [Candidatus Magasanikbacteria bacterium RIFOXYD2_FULL_36_9]
MKIKVYNLAGKETGEMEVSDTVFGVKIKPEMVHQVFVQQTNNQREPWADTKNRGEVSGGGKKPWQQKGTGRALHGSIRSPIWKGGGVAFGPLTDRNYKTKINKKTRQAAIRMCLTDKAQSGNLMVLEDFTFEKPKTQLFAKFLKTLPAKLKTFLVLTADKSDDIMRMSKNLKVVKTLRAQDSNVLDLLSKGVILTSKDGIKKMEEVFGK